MYAEEYLIDRMKKLENENEFLKSQNEMKLRKITEQNNTIAAFANILEEIMKESDLTVRDLDRHCDLGIAKIKITVLEHVYHGDLVCEILQEAYDNTHGVKIGKPWESPMSDPEFFKIAHDGMSFDECLEKEIRKKEE